MVFCHTLTWISHGFTCVPHPDPPSRVPLHPILSVFPVHKPWAPISCIQPGLVIWFTLDRILVSTLFSLNIPPLPWIFYLNVYDTVLKSLYVTTTDFPNNFIITFTLQIRKLILKHKWLFQSHVSDEWQSQHSSKGVSVSKRHTLFF